LKSPYSELLSIDKPSPDLGSFLGDKYEIMMFSSSKLEEKDNWKKKEKSVGTTVFL